MATTHSKNLKNRVMEEGAKEVESSGELSRDVVEYVTDYARQNPGYAALWCLGIGFVLGWKLKPW
jgi:hypothetical protein